MKRILALLLTVITFTAVAQVSTDRIATLPIGSVLTLKSDYVIQPYEGTISVKSTDPSYGVCNIVFASKETRRILKAGTQFTFDHIEVLPDGIKLIIKEKISYVYFGEVLNKDNLKISALEKIFDITYPAIEEF
ncbi:MAG: hypothetical protein K9I34_00555 [Bacteroidales bacterium]|nr:hypothetical protein [Bacteroidales bacterium]